MTVAPMTEKCLLRCWQSNIVSVFPLTARRVMLRQTCTLHSPVYRPGNSQIFDPCGASSMPAFQLSSGERKIELSEQLLQFLRSALSLPFNGQTLHVPASEPLEPERKVPGGQTEQKTLAFFRVKEPEGHGVHSPGPSACLYVPGFRPSAAVSVGKAPAWCY